MRLSKDSLSYLTYCGDVGNNICFFLTINVVENDDIASLSSCFKVLLSIFFCIDSGCLLVGYLNCLGRERWLGRGCVTFHNLFLSISNLANPHPGIGNEWSLMLLNWYLIGNSEPSKVWNAWLCWWISTTQAVDTID